MGLLQALSIRLTLTQLLTYSLCSFSLIDLLVLICSSKKVPFAPKSNIDSFQDGHFLDAVTISFLSPVIKSTLGTQPIHPETNKTHLVH